MKLIQHLLSKKNKIMNMKREVGLDSHKILKDMIKNVPLNCSKIDKRIFIKMKLCLQSTVSS